MIDKLNELKNTFMYNSYRARIVFLTIVALLAWIFLIGLSFNIQVYKSDYYTTRAKNQSIKRNIWKAKRGKIFDRNNKVLALNGELKTINAKGRIRKSTRFYPYGTDGAQVIGAVGSDGNGKMGLEFMFDTLLSGADGWSYSRVDVNRKYYPGMEIDGREPTPGVDIVLTLDMEIQAILEAALEKGVSKLEAKKGTAIIIDPNSGDVLGMASYPGFNPNYLYSSNSSLMRNDIIGMVYEPGSIFKLITASSALEEKSLKLDDVITGDDGKYETMNGQLIRDHSFHEKMSPADAMAYSSNVAFAKIADKLGAKEYYKYLRKFGFGSPTGIKLSGEESGVVKSINKWSGRTLVTMAMGHEILVTPLQMIMAYVAIANGGELLVPRIIKEWRDPRTGELISKVNKQVVRRVVSEETAANVRELLKGVVEYGTARNIKSDWIDFGGKTGTAEKFLMGEHKYSHKLNVSSFIGMVPATDPRFVCMVVIDEPKTKTTASYTAAPIFKEIIENVYLSPVLAPVTSRAVYRNRKNDLEVDLFVGTSVSDAKKYSKSSKYPIVIDGEEGKIVAQSVMAGAKISSKDTVHLRSAKIEYGVMPDLKGLSLRNALVLLDPMGARVEYVGKGRVDQQIPQAGEVLYTDQMCQLELKEES